MFWKNASQIVIIVIIVKTEIVLDGLQTTEINRLGLQIAAAKEIEKEEKGEKERMKKLYN